MEILKEFGKVLLGVTSTQMEELARIYGLLMEIEIESIMEGTGEDYLYAAGIFFKDKYNVALEDIKQELEKSRLKLEKDIADKRKIVS